MSEIETLTDERASAVRPQETPAVVGEPGIAERTAQGGTPWESDHPIDLRFSVPLLSQRYYVTLVAGKERRSPKRRQIERQKHPLLKLGNIIFLFTIGTLIGVATAVLIINGATQLIGESYTVMTP